MRAKDALGRYGEDLAVEYLRRPGTGDPRPQLAVPDGRARRHRPRRALPGDLRGEDAGAATRTAIPCEAVGPRKLRRLRQLALRWLDEQQVHVPEIRFDVIGIVQPPGGPPGAPAPARGAVGRGTRAGARSRAVGGGGGHGAASRSTSPTDCPASGSSACRTRRSTESRWRARCAIDGIGPHVAEPADHDQPVAGRGAQARRGTRPAHRGRACSPPAGSCRACDLGARPSSASSGSTAGCADPRRARRGAGGPPRRHRAASSCRPTRPRSWRALPGIRVSCARAPGPGRRRSCGRGAGRATPASVRGRRQRAASTTAWTCATCAATRMAALRARGGRRGRPPPGARRARPGSARPCWPNGCPGCCPISTRRRRWRSRRCTASPGQPRHAWRATAGRRSGRRTTPRPSAALLGSVHGVPCRPRRGDARASRRAVPRRGAGVRPAGARGAAAAAGVRDGSAWRAAAGAAGCRRGSSSCWPPTRARAGCGSAAGPGARAPRPPSAGTRPGCPAR